MKEQSKLKSIVSIFVLFFLTLIVLFFSLKDDFSDIVSKLSSVNLFFLFIAFLFVMLYWFFKSLILYNFTRKFNPKFKLYTSFRLQAITQFFNAVTPFSSGGQPFQIYNLTKNDLSISDATNVTIQEFIVYQIALVFLGLIAIILNHIFLMFPYDSFLSYLVVIGFTINTSIIVVLFIIAFSKKSNRFIVKFVISILAAFKIIKDKEKKIEEWNQYVNNFHTGAKTLISDKKEFFKNILISFLGLICLYIVPILVLFSMGDFVSFNGLEAIVASAYVMLIGSFVPLPGGAGGIEYGFVYFFGVFVPVQATLKALMLLWRFVTFYMGIIVGSIFLNIKERK